MRSMVRPWFWMSLGAFVLALACVAAMIGFAPRLATYGLSGNVFYVAIIPAGLCAAGFLFGALRSYAKYEGKALNGTLELGGPIVVFALVVLGAFVLPKSASDFGLVVRVTGPGGPSDLVKAGSVNIDFGTDRRTKDLGPNGEAYFNEVPARFAGQPLDVLVAAPDLEMASSAPITISADHVLKVAMKHRAIGPWVIRGRVVNSRGESVANASVSVTGLPHTFETDADGNFEIHSDAEIPSDDIRLHVTSGSEAFDDFVKPPGPITITLKVRT